MVSYPIIVVGAGHAGIEAALAAARSGVKTLLLTMNLDRVGWMSCNPAIGGIGKGHLVKEIDALGGEMAKNIDETGIQFRKLNTRKGPAVQASRAQADKVQYASRMKKIIEAQDNLDLKQGVIESIEIKNGSIKSVTTAIEEKYGAENVIITTGTFLKGLIHIGHIHYPAGRAGDMPSIGLADCFSEIFKMGRLKTGTPPRLNAKTINFEKLSPQFGDEPPSPFSFSTEKITQKQVPCYIAYTNPKTHEIVYKNIKSSAMYGGNITGVGPRYCPSIEDKIMRFSGKNRHQIFLEPEGLNTHEIYANGVSTSLPAAVQKEFIQTVDGLERAEIMRYGYAIEYDFVYPTQLMASLETKAVSGLFLAGQINGTTGYEEAAAQGIMAGINAALRFKNQQPFVLRRHEAYIGVLIDDLIIKGTQEPYRMFTSRAEYRLLLQEGNADLRLREHGWRCGLVSKEAYLGFLDKQERINILLSRLRKEKISPTYEVNEKLAKKGLAKIANQITIDALLRRPEVSYGTLVDLGLMEPEPSEKIIFQIETNIKYEGYIHRQMEHVQRLGQAENIKIPKDIDYASIPGLSAEIIERLSDARPESVGQAMRISGVTPGSMTSLMVGIKKFHVERPGK